MTRNDDLIRRIDALEAIEEIKNLKARYFRFVDEKRFDELLTLFTPDPHLVTDGITWSSPKQFADTIRDLVGAAPTVHHGHMPEIEITGANTASGIWAMEDLLTFPAAVDAPDGHRGYGHYRETYKRVGDAWLIDGLTLTRLRMDSLDNWAVAEADGLDD